MKKQTYEISEVTRRNIFDALKLGNFYWSGQLEEVNFLQRLYDLSKLPSNDNRFQTAEGDIKQHRTMNNDWDDDWIMYDERFNLLRASDQEFIKFICEIIHPAVRTNEDEVKKIVRLFNKELKNDGWELYIVNRISGRPVYSIKKISKTRKKLLFKVSPFSHTIITTQESNTCILMKDTWDDMGFCTFFHLYYFNSAGKATKIGPVRIMRKGMSAKNDCTTHLGLPTEFESLNNEYCSLGSSQDYYEELSMIPESAKDNILSGLRDCVADFDIFSEFKNEEAMQKSLLRSITVQQVEVTFRGILYKNAQLTPFKFNYILNGMGRPELEFNIVPNSMPPSNIHVLIGRNGVGKTQLLSEISNALMGINSDKKIGYDGCINFTDEDNNSNRFVSIITIVFSVFDSFSPITDTGKVRYKYVGLKKENSKEIKDPNELIGEFEESLRNCLSGIKKYRLIDSLKILNSDPCFKDLGLIDIIKTNDHSLSKIMNLFDTMSSGHKTVLLSIIRLVELVEERTIVLIDEPENHLHPPLLSSFIRAISDLLIKRNGAAIIATHSPVVLQEVPRSCVQIINRSDNIISVDRPSIETFGENVGMLTNDVFGLEVRDSGFYNLILNDIQKKSYGEIKELFANQLGLELRGIIRSLLHSKEGKI